jgi:hypothetical protein
MNARIRIASALTVLVAAVAAGCGPEPAHEAYPRDGHELDHSVAEATTAESRADRSSTVDQEDPADAGHGDDAYGGIAPGTVDAFAVAGVLGAIPSAPVMETEGPGGAPFRVALRTPSVGHYPCVACHIRPIGHKDEALAQMHGPRAEHEGATRVDCNGCHDPNRPGGMTLNCTLCHERAGIRELMPSRSAHRSVTLSHPGGADRNCFTCHAPEDPGLLTLRDGGQATLDEAYLLCRGCHYRQGEDWANGAHGKRLGGWAGERTILSCTGCHDPHDPSFPVRRPVTFPKIARPGEAR